jgi:hypothetical protein
MAKLHETADELAARLVRNHMPKCRGILNRAVDKVQAELEKADIDSNFAYELVLTLMMRVVFFRRAIADYTAEKRGEPPITTMDWVQQELNDYNDEVEACNEADRKADSLLKLNDPKPSHTTLRP